MAGGGITSLSAKGAQDAYLTGNPQITFFKLVYRRHTNFAMEPIEISMDSAKFGGRSNVQVLRNGDLATNTYLHVTLPELVATNSAFVGKLAWVRRLGHALIKSVELQIGGAQIDKQYGIWLDVFYELTHKDEQVRGYAKMIGDVPELTTLASSVPAGYHLYVPLQFWYCRNYGLALPLIALQYHEVRIYFEFETLERLVVYTRGSPQLTTVTCGTSTCASVTCAPVTCSTPCPTSNCNEICLGVAPTFGCISLCSAAVLIDYVYLDSEERRRFAQVGHEYLMEQLQYPGPSTLTANTGSAVSSQSLKLDFNHPTKEVIWCATLGAFNCCGGCTSTFLAYDPFLSTLPEQEKFLNKVAANLVSGMLVPPQCTLSDVNSSDNVSSENTLAVLPCSCPASASDYEAVTLDTENAYKTVLFAPTTGKTNTITFRFLLDVEPTGESSSHPDVTQVQVGLIKDVLKIGTVNLADSLSEVTVTVNVTDVTCATSDTPTYKTSFSITVNTHTLNMNNASVPLSQWTDKRCDRGKINDVAVCNPFNYGLNLAGEGLFVGQAKIVLNGNDRYSSLQGEYHNYVQPHQHHSHTPVDGIFLYSFALNPEAHQPSGSCNFSRIDTERLVFTTRDNLRYTPAGALMTGLVPLDVFTNTSFHVFAVNYNVLRIMSGMGGVTY